MCSNFNLLKQLGLVLVLLACLGCSSTIQPLPADFGKIEPVVVTNTTQETIYDYKAGPPNSQAEPQPEPESQPNPYLEPKSYPQLPTESYGDSTSYWAPYYYTPPVTENKTEFWRGELTVTTTD